MKKKSLILAVVAFGAFTAVAYGQETPRADKRQSYQKHRVQQGRRSGELTKKETKSIQHSVNSANRYEQKAKSDGKVTKVERVRIQHKQNTTSRKIYRTKHNGRTR